MMVPRAHLIQPTLLLAVLFAAAAAQAAPKPVPVTVRVNSQHAGYEGYRALDGNPNTMWHTEFGGRDLPGPHHITLDLGKAYEITGFSYLPRPGGGNGTIGQFECFVSDNAKDLGSPILASQFTEASAENVVLFPAPVTGRYFRLRALTEVNGRPWASIAELRLRVDGVTFRAKDSVATTLVHEDGTPFSENEVQYVTLLADIRNRAKFAKMTPETYNAESLVHDSDRDPLDIVLRRTTALLVDLKKMDGAPDLSKLEAQLTALTKAAADVDVADEDARIELYEDACKLRRQIAFSNPLLDFNQLVFIKRHRALFNHLCDQYYGMAATPGGGVYVLDDAFSDHPTVRDVLADAVVENGRLKGERLLGGAHADAPTVRFDGNGNRHGEETPGGTFLSPDLSYDAKTILFAYVENRGDMLHRHHTDAAQGHWHEGRCYHIFKVNVDGTNLLQLTDGTFNDFDPCWLPNGRVAFISERRGGYLRCGRVCPNYTLYDMAADGSDIQCLSFHETNEWHPSVTNEGMILW